MQREICIREGETDDTGRSRENCGVLSLRIWWVWSGVLGKADLDGEHGQFSSDRRGRRLGHHLRVRTGDKAPKLWGGERNKTGMEGCWRVTGAGK